ncbi:hypothetical protein BD779DRAFT_1536170 [Infundibulicybe gibba]|nr:hypothetical protein BD779DRAFT_1536170 [Infundibulicybe gibba]
MLAKLCKVCPPIMLAATPDVAVFASSWTAPCFQNISVIALISSDFPVPPWPITSISNCSVSSPDFSLTSCSSIISSARRWRGGIRISVFRSLAL